MSTPAHLAKVPEDATLMLYAVCPECDRKESTYTFSRDDGLHWLCSRCGHEEVEPTGKAS